MVGAQRRREYKKRGEGKLMNCEVMRRSPDFLLLFYFTLFFEREKGRRGLIFFLWFMWLRFVNGR